MSISQARVYGPEALSLMGRAMQTAEAMLPPVRRSEATRRKMASSILRAVARGEMDVKKLAQFAAKQRSSP